MKYFKDKNNTVFAFEDDGSQDSLIGKHLKSITEVEAIRLATPELTPEQVKEHANSIHRIYLAETDWYVTRFIETGEVIPDEISKARQAARDAVKQ